MGCLVGGLLGCMKWMDDGGCVGCFDGLLGLLEGMLEGCDVGTVGWLLGAQLQYFTHGSKIFCGANGIQHVS